MKKVSILVVFLLLSLFLIGCSQKTEEEFSISEIQSIELYIGDKLEFENIVYDSSTDILIKEHDGIYANKEGETIIQSDGKKYRIIVLEEVIFIDASAQLKLIEGEKTVIEYGVFPLKCDQKVIFTSSDENVVTVDENGNVEAKSLGVARIELYSEIYDVSSELTFVVMNEDEKYYDTIIQFFENNENIEIDSESYSEMFDLLINYNKSSIVGIKSYYSNFGTIQSQLGVGVIYRMDINYNDGSTKNRVETIYKEENISSFDYYLITSKYMVHNMLNVNIYTGDENPEVAAEVIQYDSKIDLAVVKFNSKSYYPIAKIGDSSKVQKGEFIISMGHGYNESTYNTFNFGVVSKTDCYVVTDTDGDGVGDWDSEYIQHDASLNNSDSGSPIINMKGEIIGINSKKISGTLYNNMSFAIPINIVMELVTQLEEGIRPNRPTLGVSIVDIMDYNADKEKILAQYPFMVVPEGLKYGFYIIEVNSGSVSEKAGMMKNDILIKFNDLDIKYSYQIRAELGKYIIGGGETAELTVLRNGQEVKLYVTF